MTALSLTLLLALSGLQTPARNARPSPVPEASAASPAAAAATSSEPAPEADPAAALSDTEVAGRVEALLGTIDTPVSIAQWRGLGPRGVKALAAVARDPEQLPSRRAKAVGALDALGGATAVEAVAEQAVNERAPFAVRAAALRGAGRHLSRDQLTARLGPVLERSRRASVRAAAAEVLAERAPSSCQAVRAQARREDARGRGRFARALARCESSSAGSTGEGAGTGGGEP